MLHRIVIINSAVYTKADIQLDQLNSLQLVGQNNVGKSSLINALNFLYIIDQNQMKFEGGRQLKDSLLHYFPDVEQSFVVFELYNEKRDNYHMLLVYRNQYSELIYWHIPAEYKEDYFFEHTQDGRYKVRKFQEVRSIINDEINPKGNNEKRKCKPLQDNKARYHLIYTGQDDQNAVVSLTPEAREKGSSNTNHFTKIYKYLIHPSRFSSDDLVDALMIAFNAKQIKLSVFAARDNDRLEKVVQLQQKIKLLQAIEVDYLALKEQYNLYEELRHTLGQAHYTFFTHYPKAIASLEKKLKEKNLIIKQVVEERDKIKARKEAKLTAIGAQRQIINDKQIAIREYESEVNRITPYALPVAKKQLAHDIETLEENVRTLGQLITDKGNKKEGLSAHIAQLKSRYANITRQIKEFDDLLIHHISPNREVKKRLNALLSKQLLGMSKKILTRPITKVSDKMSLFDGEIDISKINFDAHFETLEELQIRSKELAEKITLAETLQRDQAAYTKANDQLQEKRQRWMEIANLPKLKQTWDKAKQALQAAIKQVVTLEAEIAKDEMALVVAQNKVTEEKIASQKIKDQQTTYSEWASEWQSKTNIPKVTELLPIEDIATLHKQMKKDYEQVISQYKHCETMFAALKQREGMVNSDYRYVSSLKEFIERIGNELDALDDYIKSCDNMLEAVVNKFVLPTQNFLKNYNEFRRNVKQFGTQLSAIQISGIHHLEIAFNEMEQLMEDLQAISQIKDVRTFDFTGRRDAHLELLETYIKKGTEYTLPNLFRLQIGIQLKPKDRLIYLDTKRQMESRGTDKMLRILIFLFILKKILAPKKKNRIVIHIDEVRDFSPNNIKKLIEYCLECNVFPIFAGAGFAGSIIQAYYTLFPSSENQGKIYLDKTNRIVLNMETQKALPKQGISSP
ncbi:MAG: hypothetical protein AAF900_02365 [Bacteroidota bacterium]